MSLLASTHSRLSLKTHSHTLIFPVSRRGELNHRGTEDTERERGEERRIWGGIYGKWTRPCVLLSSSRFSAFSVPLWFNVLHVGRHSQAGRARCSSGCDDGECSESRHRRVRRSSRRRRRSARYGGAPNVRVVSRQRDWRANPRSGARVGLAANARLRVRPARPLAAHRGDNIVDLHDVRCQLFLARRNRLAVSAARVVAAPTTAIIEGALDAEQRQIPTLGMNPTARALAHALDDVVSMVAVPPDYPDRAIRSSIARSRSQRGSAEGIATGLRDLARQWGTIHAPELLAVGITDAGNFQRALRIAFVYANPADAAADAPELVRRLTDYRPPAPLFPTTPNAVISRIATREIRNLTDVRRTPSSHSGEWREQRSERDKSRRVGCDERGEVYDGKHDGAIFGSR